MQVVESNESQLPEAVLSASLSHPNIVVTHKTISRTRAVSTCREQVPQLRCLLLLHCQLSLHRKLLLHSFSWLCGRMLYSMTCSQNRLLAALA